MRGVARGVMRGARAPRDSGFSPLSLPDVIVWFNPRRDDLITLNGADVSDWQDVTNTATVSEATNQPLYATTGINNQPVLDFEESTADTLATAGSITHNTGTGDMYMAAVLNAESLPAGNNTFFKTDISSEYFCQGANPTWFEGTAFITFPSVALSTATDYVLEIWRDGTSVRCRRNGTLDTDTRTSSSNAGSSGVFKVGSATGGADPWDGLIGDVFLCSSLPSSDQRDANMNYLAAIHGISL